MKMEFIHGKIPDIAGKFVIYGPEGIGKSTFASKFPTPLFIDTEDSTLKMDVVRTPKPTSWTMLLEQVKYIKSNPASWQTLVIDTADWAEMLCSDHVCAQHRVSGIEDIGYGKGYTYLEEEFGRFLNLLTEVRDIGINVVVTAHAVLKKIDQPEEIGGYDHWELKLEKKVSALVKEWADTVLFANYKTYVVNVDNQGAQKGRNKAQGGKRMMFTTHQPWWDAKNRDSLDDELPFDYSAIAHIPAKRKIDESTPPATKPLEAELKVPVAGFDSPAKRVDPLPPEPDAPAEQVGIEPPATPPPAVKGHVPSDIPKALADLMLQGNVTVEEIQWAVSHCGNGGKGYYPENTPISNYDPAFVSGVLVGAWTKVFAAIVEHRGAAS